MSSTDDTVCTMNEPERPLSRGPAAVQRRTASDAIQRRDATIGEVAGYLRVLLGLDPEEPAPGERAASAGRPLPLIVAGLDAGAWIAWCLAGLPLFVDGLPSLRQVKGEAGRVLVALAMLRAKGNLSQASTFIGSSRKVLRDNLRYGGLYPWRRRLDGNLHGGRWNRGT